ncbi:MAG: hypothetical protein HY534_00230 [Chloroflexi bacterium]|nr:hypothetical protein [Chloroflexota bacterium]
MTNDTREQLRGYLVEIARAGRTATYAQVGAGIGLDVRRTADMNFLTSSLRAISEVEHREGRPLLSAVCVMAGVKRPGQGFFDLARLVGLMPAGQDNREFFEAEIARVHAYWKDAPS